MRPGQLTALCHSRGLALTAFVITVAATLTALVLGDVQPITGNRALVPRLMSPNLWLHSSTLSVGVNLLLVAAIGLGCVVILKTFNIMRAQTALWATLFMLMTASLPTLAGQLYGGTLMCSIMVGVIIMMLSCYNEPMLMRRVFAMSFMLGCAATVQYAFIFYIPLLIPGLAQMRILNQRSVIAVITGVLSPAWILFGFGLLDINDIRWPEFVSTFASIDLTSMIVTYAVVGVTILLGIAALVANLMKVIGYNAKFRAANGFLAILMAGTVLLLMVDYNNMSTYVPLLNLLVAYQVAHFFSNRRTRGSYIAIATVVAYYVVGYAASLLT